MFARNNSKVALTLLCLVVALGLATVSEANSFVHHPRDHADLNRMIKKRVPQDGGRTSSVGFPLIPIIGAEGTPTASTDTTASQTGTTTTTGTATATGTETTNTNTAAVSNPSTTSASTTSSGPVTDTTSTTSSATSTSTSQAQTTTSTSQTTSTTPTQTTPTETPTQVSTSPPNTDTQETPTSLHTSTKFITATDSSQPSPSTGASVTGATSQGSKITRTTLTVIVAVAASVGFVALAWTLFRKWKLRPSSNFDDRMQPIDWQPSGPEDSGIPAHRRTNSSASHGSFHSSGHSDAHGYGATSNRGHGLDPIGEHDFTAGPTSLAPVGGYADLQRGPSPQPPMAQLARGPSTTRADYSAYDYNNGVRY